MRRYALIAVATLLLAPAWASDPEKPVVSSAPAESPFTEDQTPPSPSTGEAAMAPKGTLQLTAMLVGEDLSVKPVPKRAFLVSAATEPAEEQRLTTGFDGRATLPLPPGSYRLRSAEPLVFESRSFTWDLSFSIEAGSETAMELSNDNAAIAGTAVSPSRVEDDESGLYRRFRDSVFTIWSERGHGSGFLVDARGLIVTNHHVVRDSDYLAVQLDPQRKYAASLVLASPSHDLAVLRVHPGVVDGIVPLPLSSAGRSESPISVGERVVAVGSPLNAQGILTSGITSKVEQDAIYTDVNMNAGNSGGPLFSMLGEVIGVNTFVMDSAQVGPGVSGAVRIHLATQLLQQAIQALGTSSPPGADRLPVASTYTFPPEELRKVALTRSADHRRYHVEAGEVDVQIITPVVIAALEIAADREATDQRARRTRGDASAKPYTPGQDFYEWRKYVGAYQPVVSVQAIPEITLTGGSVAAKFLAGMAGTTAPGRYRFKTDFVRMELRRDGVVVPPIHPGRVPNIVSFQIGVDRMHDVGFYGSYEYPPEAFKPGATVELAVYIGGRDEPRVRTLAPEQLALISGDFEPLVRSLQAEVRGSPDTPAHSEESASLDPLVLAYLRNMRGWVEPASIARSMSKPVVVVENSLERSVSAGLAIRQEGDVRRYRVP